MRSNIFSLGMGLIVILGLASCGSDNQAAKPEIIVEKKDDQWLVSANFQHEDKSFHKFEDISEVPISTKIVLKENGEKLMKNVVVDASCVHPPAAEIFKLSSVYSPEDKLVISNMLPWQVFKPHVNSKDTVCDFQFTVENTRNSQSTFKALDKKITAIDQYSNDQPLENFGLGERQDVLLKTLIGLKLKPIPNRHTRHLVCDNIHQALPSTQNQKKVAHIINISVDEIKGRQSCRFVTVAKDTASKRLISPRFFLHKTQPLVQLNSSRLYFPSSDNIELVDHPVVQMGFINPNEEPLYLRLKKNRTNNMTFKPIFFANHSGPAGNSYNKDYGTGIKWKVSGHASIHLENSQYIYIVVPAKGAFTIAGYASMNLDCSAFNSHSFAYSYKWNLSGYLTYYQLGGVLQQNDYQSFDTEYFRGAFPFNKILRAQSKDFGEFSWTPLDKFASHPWGKFITAKAVKGLNCK